MSSENWNRERLSEWLVTTRPFVELTEEAHQRLLDVMMVLEYQAGDVILKQHSTQHAFLWGVLEGEVRLFDDVFYRIEVPRFPGQLFGVQGLLSGEPLPYHAIASLSTTCVRIPAAVFTELCDQFSEFAEHFSTRFSHVSNIPDTGGWVGGAGASPYALLGQLAQHHRWGRVLDVGTGNSSLTRLLEQPTDALTAITNDAYWCTKLQEVFAEQLREQDRLLLGDWREPTLLEGEVFDTVVVDYFLGALERKAPHFQYEFFDRIKPHVGDRIFVVGLEPIYLLTSDDTIESEALDVIQQCYRLRDMCLLANGENPFREYTSKWTTAALKRAGFQVQGTQRFQRIVGIRFVHSIINSCLRMLPRIEDSQLAAALAVSLRDLRERALANPSFDWGVRCGTDYLIMATKAPKA